MTQKLVRFSWIGRTPDEASLVFGLDAAFAEAEIVAFVSRSCSSLFCSRSASTVRSNDSFSVISVVFFVVDLFFSDSASIDVLRPNFPLQSYSECRV